jgi:hypothetical protein
MPRVGGRSGKGKMLDEAPVWGSRRLVEVEVLRLRREIARETLEELAEEMRLAVVTTKDTEDLTQATHERTES